MENVFRQILSAVLAQGFESPLRIVLVAANGSIMCFEYVEAEAGALEARELATHEVSPGLALPINVMIVDAQGEAARAVIANDGAPRFVN